MNWYLEVLKKYAVFHGRAQRKEYWMFLLFNIIVSLVLTVIETLVDIQSILSGIYSLAVLLPGLAVSVRRLHDTNRSGWWLLISLIPILGAIVLIVFMAQDGHPDENQYGFNPKLKTI